MNQKTIRVFSIYYFIVAAFVAATTLPAQTNAVPTDQTTAAHKILSKGKKPSGAETKARAKSSGSNETTMATWRYAVSSSDDIISQTDDGRLAFSETYNYGLVTCDTWRIDSVTDMELWEDDNEIWINTADNAVCEQYGDNTDYSSCVLISFNQDLKDTMHQVVRKLRDITGIPVHGYDATTESLKQKIASARLIKNQKKEKASAKMTLNARSLNHNAMPTLARMKAKVKVLDTGSSQLVAWHEENYEDRALSQSEDGMLIYTSIDSDDGYKTVDTEIIDAITYLKICKTDENLYLNIGTNSDSSLDFDYLSLEFNLDQQDALNQLAQQLASITGKPVQTDSSSAESVKQKIAKVKARQASARAGASVKNSSQNSTRTVVKTRAKAKKFDINSGLKWSACVSGYIFGDECDNCTIKSNGKDRLYYWAVAQDGTYISSDYWPANSVLAITLYPSSDVTGCSSIGITTDNSIIEQCIVPDDSSASSASTNNVLYLYFQDASLQSQVANEVSSLTGVSVTAADSSTEAVRKQTTSPHVKAIARAKAALAAKKANSAGNVSGKTASQLTVSDQKSAKSAATAKSRTKSLKTNNTLLASWKHGTGDYADAYALYQSNDGQLILSDQFMKDYYLSSWKGSDAESLTIYEADNSLCLETSDADVSAEYSSDGSISFNTPVASSVVWLDFNADDKDTLHQVAHQLESVIGKTATAEDAVPYAKKQKRTAFKSTLKHSPPNTSSLPPSDSQTSSVKSTGKMKVSSTCFCGGQDCICIIDCGSGAAERCGCGGAGCGCQNLRCPVSAAVSECGGFFACDTDGSWHCNLSGYTCPPPPPPPPDDLPMPDDQSESTKKSSKH